MLDWENPIVAGIFLKAFSSLQWLQFSQVRVMPTSLHTNIETNACNHVAKFSGLKTLVACYPAPVAESGGTMQWTGLCGHSWFKEARGQGFWPCKWLRKLFGLAMKDMKDVWMFFGSSPYPLAGCCRKWKGVEHATTCEWFRCKLSKDLLARASKYMCNWEHGNWEKKLHRLPKPIRV